MFMRHGVLTEGAEFVTTQSDVVRRLLTATALAATATCSLFADLDAYYGNDSVFQVYISGMPDIDLHRDANYNSEQLAHNGKNHRTAVAAVNLFWYAASNGLKDTGFYAPTNLPWDWYAPAFEYFSYLRTHSMGENMWVNKMIGQDYWGPCFSCFDEIQGQYNPNWEFGGMRHERAAHTPGNEVLFTIRPMSFGGFSEHDGWTGGDIGQAMAAGSLVLLRVRNQFFNGSGWSTFGQGSWSVVGINGQQTSLADWEKRRIFIHEGDNAVRNLGQRPPETESTHWWPNETISFNLTVTDGSQWGWYHNGIPLSNRLYQPGDYPQPSYFEIRAISTHGWTFVPATGYTLHPTKLFFHAYTGFHYEEAGQSSSRDYEMGSYNAYDFVEDEGNLRIFVSGTDPFTGQHTIRVINRLTGELDNDFSVPLEQTSQPAMLAVSNVNALYVFDADRVHRMSGLRSDDPYVATASLAFPVAAVAPDDRNNRMIAISADGSRLMSQPYIVGLEPEWIDLPAAIDIDGRAFMDVNPVDGSIWIASQDMDVITRLVADSDDPNAFQMSTFQPSPGAPFQGVSFDDLGVLHATIGDEVLTYSFDEASASLEMVESLFSGTYSPGPFKVLKSRHGMLEQVASLAEDAPFLDYDPLQNPPCMIDLNLDGVVDGIDLATLLGAWGQVTAWSTALDSDSPEVDGADLATLLGAWGPCVQDAP